MPLKNHFLFVLFLAIGSLTAQTDSLGEWNTLQSYRFGTYVTQSPNSIIYTTGKAIFYLDKEDLSISRLAREDGLAEARIRLIRYHVPTETLIIIYESGVIDLLRNGQFSTLRQIDNFNFSGDKRINEMFFDPDRNVVYLAAGYGLSALDLDDETFLFTTFTGVGVNGTAIHDGFIYVATEEGIYRAARQGVNLNDFGNWELMGQTYSLPGDYESTAINVFKDELYFGVDEDVFKLQADTAALHYDASDAVPWRLQYLSVSDRRILAGYSCPPEDCGSRQLAFLNERGVTRTISFCIFKSRYALEDEQGRIWFAEESGSGGIRYLESSGSSDCSIIEYDGPLMDDNFRLHHDGTSLWVAPSLLDENFSPKLEFNGAYRFRDGEWSFFNSGNVEAFRGRDGVVGGDDDAFSIVDVYYDEANNLHWFSSFFEGVVALDVEAGTGELFDEFNTSLENELSEAEGRVRVAGVVSDAEGFTYVANSIAENGSFLHVRSPEGEWAALGGDCSLNNALAIEIDELGYLWVVHATSIGVGLTVTDPMGTPLDASDDRCRTILSNNSNLPSNNVRSVAVDLDGNVWVGTSQGIALFECGQDVFDPSRCPGRLPIVEADDFGGFLLETEEIRSITVDGGNRKWIGTSGGAYLLSDDGSEQLLFFDSGNSPLLNNIVRDIAIDPTSGIVYFGTERGIISYRATATTASERTFKNDLVIFPNPVEPGYDGPVAINGLARDARVKITDLSGKLVAEGVATGGQFVWPGTDYNGRRVTSGVYLVFGSTNGRFGLNDPDSAVGKIVFIR